MDARHSAEYVSAHWGALRAGHQVAVLPPARVDSVDALRQAVLDEAPSVLLVSPNHPTRVADSDTHLPKKDLLARALPEVFASAPTPGEPLSLDSVPALRYIVQTGFYALPGAVKFRDVLVYRSPKYSTSAPLPEAPRAPPPGHRRAADWLGSRLPSAPSGDAMVFNVLDLHSAPSVDSLTGCLQLAQDRGVFTNVVPSQSLDALLERRFLADLTATHRALVVGTPADLDKVRAALGAHRVDCLDVSQI